VLTKEAPLPATVRNMISFLEGPELIIVLVVVLVLFGGSQLPKFAKNLGSAQKEFKKAMDEGKSDDSSSDSQ
jgi:sec-independent protein translocase protein TatA